MINKSNLNFCINGINIDEFDDFEDSETFNDKIYKVMCSSTNGLDNYSNELIRTENNNEGKGLKVAVERKIIVKQNKDESKFLTSGIINDVSLNNNLIYQNFNNGKNNFNFSLKMYLIRIINKMFTKGEIKNIIMHFINKDKIDLPGMIIYKSLKSNSKKGEYVECLFKLIYNIIYSNK
jgi:hypothetical protein